VKDDQDLLNRIHSFYYNDLRQFYDEDDGQTKDVLDELKKLLENIHNYREGLYVNGGLTLTQISQKIFGRWNYINEALSDYYDTVINPPKPDKNGRSIVRTKKEEKEKERWLKQKQFLIITIEEALSQFKQKETNEELKNKITETTLCDFFKRCGANEEGKDNLFERIEQNLKMKNEHGESVKDLLHTNSKKSLLEDKSSTLLIKNFLDVLQGDKEDITSGLLHFIKALIPREEVGLKNEDFYSQFEKYYRQLSEITPLYNKARNYLTQKPYSIEKVKLNFENSTLLDGWDRNKEKDNTCVLLRKKMNDQYFYFLGILNKKHKKIFENYPTADKEPYYEKMVYKLVANPTKDLPNLVVIDGKTSMVKGRKNHEGENKVREQKLNKYLPPVINRIRKSKTYSSNNLVKDDLTKFIQYYQERVREYFTDLNFHFKEASEYNSWADFLDEVKQQGYSINFKTISEDYINNLVNEGKLYLFKIHNKDFSENKKSKGKDNLHTLYWKMLFDERNLKDVVLQLNGKAEVFYRPKSVNYSEDIWQKGYHYDELKEKFNYPIIKDKRYAEHKFFFHVPITLNFKSVGKNNINEKVNQWLMNNPNIHIIGIDRGERHLLYVSVINQKGEIVEQCSLNEIISEYKGHSFSKNYHQLLDKREGEREKARKDWQTIENIKELKEGYLSHVIHKITQLILKYNAIVVMEDLNVGFKRGRQKVEKQVYQNFEKMLIEKLNFLAIKDKKPEEPGGVLKAFQLSNKFESFKKLGKQSGIIFYVPAGYTSSIDPLTGYVHYLTPLKLADSIEKARNFYKKFKSIRFNTVNEWFEFSFDYNDFERVRYEGKSDWVICTSNSERYVWNKALNNGKGGAEQVKVTERLEVLFGEYEIDYGSGKCIIDQIVNVNDLDKERTAKKFYSTLNFLLNTTLKLRHNNGMKGKEEQDYILSPVSPFFDSRKENAKSASEQKLPTDADANGAYHIALKGLLLMKRLKEIGVEAFEKSKNSKDGKSQWLPNDEWLVFVQNKNSVSEPV
jgi:hypothetical protein